MEELKKTTEEGGDNDQEENACINDINRHTMVKGPAHFFPPNHAMFTSLCLPRFCCSQISNFVLRRNTLVTYSVTRHCSRTALHSCIARQ